MPMVSERFRRLTGATGRGFVGLYLALIIAVSVVNLFLELPVILPETGGFAIMALSSFLFFIPVMLFVSVVAGLAAWFRARRRFRAAPPAPDAPAPRPGRYVYVGVSLVIGLIWLLVGMAVASIGSLAFGGFFVWVIVAFAACELCFQAAMKLLGGRGPVGGRLVCAALSPLPFLAAALALGLFPGRWFLIMALALGAPFSVLGLTPLRLGLGAPPAWANRTTWRSMHAAGFFFIVCSVIGFMNHKIVYLPPCHLIDRNPHLTRLSDVGKPYDLLLEPDGRYLYATTGVLHRVLRIDLEDPTRVEELDTGPATRPERMAMDPERNELYIENSHENSPLHIIAVDLEAFELKPGRSFSSPMKRTAVWIDIDRERDNLLVTYEHVNATSVAAYDIERMQELGRTGLGWRMKDPYAGVLHRGLDAFFVTSWITGRHLVRFDPATLRVTGSTHVGPMSAGIAAHEGRGLVYVAGLINGSIRVVDGRSMEKLDEFRAGFGIRDLTVDHGRDLIYAGNFCDGTFDVFEAATGKLLHRLKIGIASRAVHYDAGRDRLFVASECGVFEVHLESLLGSGP